MAAAQTISTVTGGKGGAGGSAGAGGSGGAGGAGGAGGVGVLLTSSGNTVFNRASDSITGGAGGAGGSGAAAGIGGVGVSGSGMTVINLGTISGGLSGAGVEADATDFNGGTNTLSLGVSQSMTGSVNVGSGASLTIDQTVAGANGALSNTLSERSPGRAPSPSTTRLATPARLSSRARATPISVRRPSKPGNSWAAWPARSAQRAPRR
jgi:hypothetical protein